MTLLLGEIVDSAVIFGVVLVNAVVGFVQESKAEAALDALRSMVHTDARVRRDGRQRTVPSEELVPGDMVLIEAGDKVPADVRLVEITELQVDESALTGESLPVVKDEVVLTDDDAGSGPTQHGLLGDSGHQRCSELASWSQPAWGRSSVRSTGWSGPLTPWRRR